MDVGPHRPRPDSHGRRARRGRARRARHLHAPPSGTGWIKPSAGRRTAPRRSGGFVDLSAATFPRLVDPRRAARGAPGARSKTAQATSSSPGREPGARRGRGSSRSRASSPSPGRSRARRGAPEPHAPRNDATHDRSSAPDRPRTSRHAGGRRSRPAGAGRCRRRPRARLDAAVLADADGRPPRPAPTPSSTPTTTTTRAASGSRCIADDRQLTVVVRDRGSGIQPRANRSGSRPRWASACR